MRILLSAAGLMLAVTGAAVVAPSAAGIAVDLKQAQAEGSAADPEEVDGRGWEAARQQPARTWSSARRCEDVQLQPELPGHLRRVPARRTPRSRVPLRLSSDAALKAAAKPAAGAEVPGQRHQVVQSASSTGAKAVGGPCALRSPTPQAICISSGSSVKQIQACAARLIAAMQKKSASVA